MALLPRRTSTILAGCVQGFAISTSGSRTAVVEQAGARSKAASVVAAGAVGMLRLLFLNGLLSDLPQSVLAAVLIAAALTLMDLAVLRRYYRVPRSADSLQRRRAARSPRVAHGAAEERRALILSNVTVVRRSGDVSEMTKLVGLGLCSESNPRAWGAARADTGGACK
jgi:hypothetical protein